MSSYFHVSSEFHIWSVQLGAIILVALCGNFVLLRLFAFLQRRAESSRAHSSWKGALLQSIRLPASLLLWLIAFSAAVSLLRGVLPARFFVYLREARGISLVFVLALFAIRLIGNMETRLSRPQEGKQSLDPSTARAIGKVLRLMVLAIALLMGLQTIGVSVAGVLAFGGVGAMAIGFAAKDMLSNFFGGLMIYLDRPFSVGDWVRSPDRDIEGTVEDIGWRITRIRSPSKRPLYIPNALFTSIVLENPSRMSHRRIDETLGVRYDDASKVAAICDDVRQMLHSHPEIDQEQKIVVRFNACGASSLDIMVCCFTRVTEWAGFHAVKEDVMFKIMDIVARHGAEFAFPTRTLCFGAQDAAAASALAPASCIDAGKSSASAAAAAGHAGVPGG